MGLLGPLHYINPARFAYFKTVTGDLQGVKVLELAGGGGLSPGGFARGAALFRVFVFRLVRSGGPPAGRAIQDICLLFMRTRS